MNSRIFNTAVRIIFPIQIVVSIIILFRGHNNPGGGFIGGLILAVSIVLKSLTKEKGKPSLHWNPKFMMAFGLLCALTAGTIPLFIQKPFLTGLWPDLNILGFIPSTVFFFDLGVYLLVTGMVLQVVQALEEELEV